MARSVHKQATGSQPRVGQIHKAPTRRKKTRSLLTNVAIGVGLTVATLTCASMVTMATAVKSASGVKFETALTRPLIVNSSTAQMASLGDREIDISKFSRLPGRARSAQAERGKRPTGADGGDVQEF
jgi:hypothetical protein